MPEPTQNKTAGDKKPTKDNTREFAGMPIVVEWDEGDIRKGKTEEGKEWERIMAAPYGYILGTTGAGDKEGVDVYLGANENAPNVFVIEQLKEDGSFDEYKTMLGFDTLDEARDMYLKHYPKSWKENRLGEVATFPIEEFRQTVFQNQNKDEGKEAGSQGDDVSQMFWTDPNAFSLTASEKVVIGNACKLAITTEDREMIEALSGHVVDEAEVDDYELVLVGSDLLPDFYQVGMQRKGLSMADPAQQMTKQPGGLKTNWRETMARIKAVVDRWLAEYGRLYAVSHSPDKQAQYVRLLKRLGYNVGEDVMELPGMNIQVPYIQKTAVKKPSCPYCGSKDYGLMPTDFETAKCNQCGKNWDHGIVPGINDPSDSKTAAQYGPVYHGTYKEWSDKIQIDQYKIGKFFSSDQLVAQAYGSFVYECYLTMNKPFIVDAKGSGYFSIPTPKTLRGWVAEGMDKVDTDIIAKYAYEHGYDGVIVKNVIELHHEVVADDYIIFKPNQVKRKVIVEPEISPFTANKYHKQELQRRGMRGLASSKIALSVDSMKHGAWITADGKEYPLQDQEMHSYGALRIGLVSEEDYPTHEMQTIIDEALDKGAIRVFYRSGAKTLVFEIRQLDDNTRHLIKETVSEHPGKRIVIESERPPKYEEFDDNESAIDWLENRSMMRMATLNKIEKISPSDMTASVLDEGTWFIGSDGFWYGMHNTDPKGTGDIGDMIIHGDLEDDLPFMKTEYVRAHRGNSYEFFEKPTEGQRAAIGILQKQYSGKVYWDFSDSAHSIPRASGQGSMGDFMRAVDTFYRGRKKSHWLLATNPMKTLESSGLVSDTMSGHKYAPMLILTDGQLVWADSKDGEFEGLAHTQIMEIAYNKPQASYGLKDVDNFVKKYGMVRIVAPWGEPGDHLVFQMFRKPTSAQIQRIAETVRKYGEGDRIIAWELAGKYEEGTIGQFQRAVEGKFSSWLLKADSPQLTPHRYEEFKPGTNGYALQPDRREGDAGLTMPALEDMAKKQDLNELQMVDGDKTIYPHRQGLPNAFEIHGAERTPGIPAGEEDVPGTVYLIHTDKPFHHLRHYLGWTSDLDARLEAHRSGKGANVMRVLKEQGIGWEVARTWNNVTRKFERRLKNQGGLSRHCPVCKAQGLICPSRERVKALEAPEGVDYEVSCPVTKQGVHQRGLNYEPHPSHPDATAVVASIMYWNDVYDCHRGECFGAIYATTEGGKGVLAGRLTYSTYDNEVNVKMIETAPDVRRQGIGTKMVEKLKETYPDMKINWGMSTPEGTEFLKSIQGSKTASEIVPFYHGTSWEDAALIQKTGLRAHPWQVDPSKSFVWATVVPNQAISYGKSKTDNNEFAVVEFFWDYDRSEADPEHGEHGDAYRRIPANIPMPMIHQITYFDPGGSIDHVWRPGKAASDEVSKFSSWMLLAANYEDMFKQLLAFEPKLKPDVKREIDWAKSTLKKSDRIVWYLRWVRLWYENGFAFGQPSGWTETENKDYKDKAKAILDKDIATYNGKSPKTKITTEDTGNFTIRDLKRKLEHYFSLEGPEIEGFQLGYETPDQAFEQLEAAEDVIKERVQAEGRKIPEESMESGDVPFIKFGDGWVWWLLPRAYCPEEARAMGHCGNQPRSHTSDRILSLREPMTKGGKKYWVPHLTFVIDEKGFLGEMKGRGNDKPVKKYHPYIITLLKDERIKGTKGATWYAENNFKLKDLTEEERQEIYDANPAFGGLSKKWKEYGINEAIIEEIAERLNIDSEKFRPDWDAFVVRQWTSVKDCVSSIGEGDADEAAEWASMTDEQREREVAREHSRRKASLDDTEEVAQSVLSKCADNTIRNMVDALRREVPDVIEEFKGVHAKYSGNPDWDLNNASDSEIADLLYIAERETGFNTSVWTNIKAAFDKAVENDRRWALASDLEYELTSGMYERGDDIWTELRFGDDNKFKWDASPVYELITLDRAKELADPTNDYPEKKRNLEYGGDLSVYISQENYESRDAEDLDDPFAILDAIYSGKMPQREDRRQFKLFEPPSKETVADIHEYLKENRLPEGKRLEEINTILAENAGKWDADQDYYAGEIIFDDDSGTYQMCTTPGKSGIEKPEFSRAGVLRSLNDEGVVWKRVDRENLADELHSLFINQALAEGRAGREPEPAGV